VSDAGIDIAAQGPDSLSAAAWGNWFRKHQYRYSERWLREINAFHPNDPALEPAKTAIRPTLEQAIRDDQKVWHGWYASHGGEIEFFGDHFGSGDATSAVLVLLAVAVLWTMARRVPAQAAPVRVSAARPAAAKARPTRKKR
jgi:hypothetical protein